MAGAILLDQPIFGHPKTRTETGGPGPGAVFGEEADVNRSPGSARDLEDRAPRQDPRHPNGSSSKSERTTPNRAPAARAREVVRSRVACQSSGRGAQSGARVAWMFGLTSW